MSNKTSDENVAKIEDDIKVLNELLENVELTFGGWVDILNEREKKALRNILAELEQKDKRIQELEAKLEFKEYGDLDNLQFEEYMNQFIPKQAIIDLIENETINISGFECIAVEDLQKLLEGEK